MTTKEILHVLYSARAQYRAATLLKNESSRVRSLEILRVFNGLCDTVLYCAGAEKYRARLVIDQLLTDLSQNWLPSDIDFWYRPPSPNDSLDFIQKVCLEPRLEHLTRTITRLENLQA